MSTLEAKSFPTRLVVAAIAAIILALAVMPGEAKAMTPREYWQKSDAFLDDSRWCNGTSWNQIPSKSSPERGYYGCWAYGNDFAYEVYGIPSYQSGQSFANPSEIRSGDVIRINGAHTLVVVERNGSVLRTAEGGYGDVPNQVVRVSREAYYIDGNTLYDVRHGAQTVTEAYHFDTGGATTYDTEPPGVSSVAGMCIKSNATQKLSFSVSDAAGIQSVTISRYEFG